MPEYSQKHVLKDEAFVAKVNYTNAELLRKIELDEPIFLTVLLQAYDKKNANGRIYPKDVLTREVQKYQKLIKQNTAIGELDHPCFDENVDILTLDGWKPIVDISEDEVVLTFNMDTKKYEYQHITEKIVEHHVGNMIRLKHKTLNMLVTPNHKFVLKGRSDSTQKDKYELIEARELQNNRKKRLIRTESNWDGFHKEVWTLGDISIPMSDFVAFMGIFLSEGHTSNYTDNGHYTFGISQKKSNNVIKIKELLDRLPFNFSYSGNMFTANNKKMWTYLKQFGQAYDKFIPADLKLLNPNYLQILFDWLMIGDGTRINTVKNNVNRYYSTSKKLIDDVQEILFKLGFASSIVIQKQKDRFIEGRLIKEENSNDIYRLTVYKTNYLHNDKRNLSITEEEYDGKIYCVTVPNHTIVVRDNQNKSIIISGNSERDIIEYKTASHKINKLWWEGSELWGTVEILSGKHFPMANILRGCLLHNIPIGFSSRGLGSELDMGNDTVQVDEDFDLIGWDAVTQPSTFGAFAYIAESTQKARDKYASKMKSINKLIYQILN